MYKFIEDENLQCTFFHTILIVHDQLNIELKDFKHFQ